MGVPVPSVFPWANQPDDKGKGRVMAAEMSKGSKETEKDADNARLEKETATAAKRFLQLNAGKSTGGVTDKFGVTRVIQGLGSDYAEMEAITAKLAPSMRPTGSGSTSDKDMALFQKATVGVDKTGKANANIAQGIITRAQTAQDYANFRQTYLEQNGTLQGADRNWKSYSDANPIFDPKANDYSLNKDRQSWQSHFAGSGAPSAAPTAPTGAASVPSAPAQRQAAPTQGGVSVMLPNGKSASFGSEADAAAFRKKAGL